jgi:hypothetical protein
VTLADGAPDVRRLFCDSDGLSIRGFGCMLVKSEFDIRKNHMPTLNWIGKDAVINHHIGKSLNFGKNEARVNVYLTCRWTRSMM